jgi:hypothetical protein
MIDNIVWIDSWLSIVGAGGTGEDKVQKVVAA